MTTSNNKTVTPEDHRLTLELAELLGWTFIVYMGNGTYLGKPPGGSPHSRDQARLPDWLGDYNVLIPLSLRHGIYPDRAMATAAMVQHDLPPTRALAVGLAGSLIAVLRINRKGTGNNRN